MKLRSRTLWLALLVVFLCGLHAWMAASVSRTFGNTSDEIAHLTSGYAYWTQHDYRFQPENGNLPQRWAALPLLWMNVKFPATSGDAWETGNVWLVGHDFFYKQGNDLPAMLAAGRLMIALLSALLCGVIYRWTRDLFGWRAGLLALTMAVFAPELLAHAGLTTSDTAATLGFAIAVLSWWRLLHRPTAGRLLLAGLCVGFLALAKYSVVLFGPVAVLLVIVRLLRPAPLRLGRNGPVVAGWRRWPVAAALLGATAILSFAVIWSAYGFRYSAAAAPQDTKLRFIRTWDQTLLKVHPNPAPQMADDGTVDFDRVNWNPGIVQHTVRWCRDHRLLPEAWLYGLAFVETNARGRMAFFGGDYRITGWRTFFPVAFLLKTTLPALALTLLGVIGLASAAPRRRTVWFYRVSPLLIFLAVYWAFSIPSHLNIGHRHLLPTYAACYILAGGTVLLARRHRAWAVVLAILLVWQVRESLAIRPDYLAYFNPICGGPEEAHRVFVDSSLDWGQDLPRLRDWLGARAAGEKVFISYFGTDSPPHQGISATRIGDGIFDWYGRKTPPHLTGGVYCISATMLHRVYNDMRGPWSIGYEQNYQRIGRWIAHAGAIPKDEPITDMDGAPMSQPLVESLLLTYEQLMFGRLCHFLQLREPDARIGYSIFVWRLSDADVEFALKAPLLELNARLLQSLEPRTAAP